jgi:hypothetical protein
VEFGPAKLQLRCSSADLVTACLDSFISRINVLLLKKRSGYNVVIAACDGSHSGFRLARVTNKRQRFLESSEVFRRVLLAVDGSQRSEAVVHALASEINPKGAEVLILCVVEPLVLLESTPNGS